DRPLPGWDQIRHDVPHHGIWRRQSSRLLLQRRAELAATRRGNLLRHKYYRPETKHQKPGNPAHANARTDIQKAAGLSPVEEHRDKARGRPTYERYDGDAQKRGADGDQ